MNRNKLFKSITFISCFFVIVFLSEKILVAYNIQFMRLGFLNNNYRIDLVSLLLGVVQGVLFLKVLLKIEDLIYSPPKPTKKEVYELDCNTSRTIEPPMFQAKRKVNNIKYLDDFRVN